MIRHIYNDTYVYNKKVSQRDSRPTTVTGPKQGRYVNVTVGSTTPRVMTVEGFLSLEECEELIGAARGKMAPSTVSSQVFTTRYNSLQLFTTIRPKP